MKIFEHFKVYANRHTTILFFGITIFWWVFTFRGFLSGRLALQGDATSYYDHIKFFVESMMQGSYPLWDPHWNHGVPNEFFLRRMGSYNPFYIIIVAVRSLGLSYLKSYMFFLTLYYFLGMTGFYLLTKRLLHNNIMALTAFLLLVTSSFTTSLFSSFIILVFTPMAWFFFALIAFAQEPKRLFLALATFSLMLLMITYIPFYFLTVFLVFLLMFVVLFFKSLQDIVKKSLQFFFHNKIFTILCVSFILVSIIPGYVFHKSAAEGEIVLPLRHSNASEDNALAVEQQSILTGGITSDITFDQLFSGLDSLELGVLYISLFSYLLFLLGAVSRINTRMILYALCFFWIYAIGLYDITPVYGFLYKHVFFFKYFRNFQFFPWLGMLPFYILICVEHLNSYVKRDALSRRQYYGEQFILISMHIVFAIFLALRGNMLLSSYLVVIFSLVFFLRTHFLLFKKGHGAGKRFPNLFLLFGIMALTLLSPLEVYTYLVKNSAKTVQPYTYDNISNDFRYRIRNEPLTFENDSEGRVYSVYYGTQWYNIFFQKLNSSVFRHYVNHKFIIYNHIEDLTAKKWHISDIEKAIINKEDKAFVFWNPEIKRPVEKNGGAPVFVTGPSDQLDVLSYKPNHIKLKTNFSEKKFLVYNDAFHSGWRAIIDRKETILWRANLAFKGVWIPPGERIVEFRFGSMALRIFHAIYFLLFYGFFIYILTGYFQYYKHNSASHP